MIIPDYQKAPQKRSLKIILLLTLNTTFSKVRQARCLYTSPNIWSERQRYIYRKDIHT